MKRLVIGRVTYRPEMREEFLAMSLRHQAATRAEPGCEFFEVALSLDEPNVAVVTECFTSEAAYELHRATPHMAAFVESMRASSVRVASTTSTRTTSTSMS